eukprot:TRINITY_DN883_c3_g2_i4.p1 TRINITY_DN883_c3_g2~~TRINITY_DN883_c3_g2_i4.p1  ORF type:complete len:733 (+),score=160.94 TRINITY_DN883_c3_g2_i4:116-2314(+)
MKENPLISRTRSARSQTSAPKPIFIVSEIKTKKRSISLPTYPSWDNNPNHTKLFDEGETALLAAIPVDEESIQVVQEMKQNKNVLTITNIDEVPSTPRSKKALKSLDKSHPKKKKSKETMDSNEKDKRKRESTSPRDKLKVKKKSVSSRNLQPNKDDSPPKNGSGEPLKIALKLPLHKISSIDESPGDPSDTIAPSPEFFRKSVSSGTLSYRPPATYSPEKGSTLLENQPESPSKYHSTNSLSSSLPDKSPEGRKKPKKSRNLSNFGVSTSLSLNELPSLNKSGSSDDILLSPTSSSVLSLLSPKFIEKKTSKRSMKLPEFSSSMPDLDMPEKSPKQKDKTKSKVKSIKVDTISLSQSSSPNDDDLSSSTPSSPLSSSHDDESSLKKKFTPTKKSSKKDLTGSGKKEQTTKSSPILNVKGFKSLDRLKFITSGEERRKTAEEFNRRARALSTPQPNYNIIQQQHPSDDDNVLWTDDVYLGQKIVSGITKEYLSKLFLEEGHPVNWMRVMVLVHPLYSTTRSFISQLADMSSTPSNVSKVASLIRLWLETDTSVFVSNESHRKQMEAVISSLPKATSQSLLTLFEGSTKSSSNKSDIPTSPKIKSKLTKGQDWKTYSVLDFHPTDLAEQITLIDHQMFSKITPDELLNKNFTKEELCPNLTKISERFNQMTSWIGSEITLTPNIKLRRKIIGHFIIIGVVCNNNIIITIIINITIVVINITIFIVFFIEEYCG